ncbi:MAG TPA: phosphate ABC transporter ATP-binding protein PstB [Leptospiraceae bacterium]|nr:phosphate ABC transporter ATP-binding protein PstB [Leptospirales bacterium]HMU82696.1 phosphate ABC transporter ATP-binding protein PstB [Leptospiraceae bacterium]HMX57040.1 phosphate ABC transporter ATP-binding protein PstB [Leptospiraceae bacterium]HMZ35523.1 phosphate ABC transporter ATP-binding protein PstB [Leptospiraceae bacterium]HNE23175.1 phosphate ABC transporter ATP-binding protein PstB [Leptospiraceae bacterium]
MQQITQKIAAPENGDATRTEAVFACSNVNIHYGDFHAIQDLSLDLLENRVTALIGPSGCGKSTFLRSLNRMNDFIDSFRISGSLLLDGEDIYAPDVDPVEIRLRVGMVFQSPNPFPKSIRENVALGPRINGYKGNLAELVEEALVKSYLWDEVKDKLDQSAYSLSGGQQQRLCIARAIAMQPEVLLMDEPTASLDPISTKRIEELIVELKKSYSIVIVTHNMQQAARIGDFTAFFYQGKLIEYDSTFRMFTNPGQKLTEDYITGRFG